jgi:hypothetical protein
MNLLKNHLMPIVHNLLASLIWTVMLAGFTSGALLAFIKPIRDVAFSAVKIPGWLIVITVILCIFLLIRSRIRKRGWLSRAIRSVRERFSSTGAPGITFVVGHERRVDLKFKCKIHVGITNRLRGAVRLADAYFVFDEASPLKPDAKWSREANTGRFPLCFFSPPTGMHDWPDVYLRNGEATDVWIGIDPQHSDDDIKQAIQSERIGQLSFQMTDWTDSGNPKATEAHVKL